MVSRFRFLILCAVLQLTYGFKIQPKAGQCTLNIGGSNNPVIVIGGTNNFLYPKPGEDSVVLNAGDIMDIACPGGTLSVGSKNDPFVQAVCVSGTTFSIDGENTNFNKITCSRYPFHTARYTYENCEENGKEIEIGYEFGADRFVRQIRLCFDDELLISRYSEYNLTASIGAHESGIDRPSFIQDDFYDFDIDNHYERSHQRQTINSLVGISSSSTKYIQNNDYFLSRGHYTAKADFVYGYQQRATFHYVNVAPQWQTFNGNNWNTLEMNVRDYADANALDLRVITGVYGIATLPYEETGEAVQLYIVADQGASKLVPVPQLYWKVIYNPATEEGVAFVGVNNPYDNDLQDAVICEDISDTISWIHWKADDLEQGYSYVCTVDDLRKTVTYIPELVVMDVLR